LGYYTVFIFFYEDAVEEVGMLRFSELSAGAQQELLTLFAQYDGAEDLFPRAVLERAMQQTSALHAYFEWDDDKAARRYRCTQAKVIGSVHQAPV
jgi:hypothetical protein